MQVLTQIVPGQVVEGRKYPDTLYVTGVLERSELGSNSTISLYNEMRKSLPERFDHSNGILYDLRVINSRLHTTWIVPNYNKYR